VWFKNFLKSCLLILGKIFPESTMNNFIDFIYPLYKKAVRLLYLFKGFFRPEAESEMIKKIYNVMPYTMVGTGGLEVTYKVSRELNEKGVHGNFIELGVAKGGCAALICGNAFSESASVSREVWLFDSFEGLPDATEEDYEDGRTGNHIRPLGSGACLGPIEVVKHVLFDRFRFPANKIHLVKGWFQDTLPVEGKSVGKIALLRLDGDWYESTKVCLEHLYDQVVEGGAIIIDDYDSCFGCKKAVDEFIQGYNLNVDMKFDGRGGSYFWKN
jgi:O-methyltransferase